MTRALRHAPRQGEKLSGQPGNIESIGEHQWPHALAVWTSMLPESMAPRVTATGHTTDDGMDAEGLQVGGDRGDTTAVVGQP